MATTSTIPVASATERIVRAASELRTSKITGDQYRALMAELRACMSDHDYNAAKLAAARLI